RCRRSSLSRSRRKTSGTCATSPRTSTRGRNDPARSFEAVSLDITTSGCLVPDTFDTGQSLHPGFTPLWLRDSCRMHRSGCVVRFAAPKVRSTRKPARAAPWPRARWLSQLRYYDVSALKERLSFIAMAGVPIVLVGSIVLFAYSHRTPYDKVALESAQRKAAAHRAR